MDGEYKYINNTTNNYAKQDSDDVNYTQLAIISLVCISSILGWIHKYYYNKKLKIKEKSDIESSHSIQKDNNKILDMINNIQNILVKIESPINKNN
jgi:hypothetical protein